MLSLIHTETSSRKQLWAQLFPIMSEAYVRMRELKRCDRTLQAPS